MPLSRRSLLALGIGAITAGVAGCTNGSGGTSSDAYCVSRGEVARHGRLGNARLVYDISGEPTSFRFDSGFYGQLERWLTDYRKLSGIEAPDHARLRTGPLTRVASHGGNHPIAMARTVEIARRYDATHADSPIRGGDERRASR